MLRTQTLCPPLRVPSVPLRAALLAVLAPLVAPTAARAQALPEPDGAAQGLRLGELLRYLPLRARTLDAAIDLVPGIIDVAPRFAPGGGGGPGALGSGGAENGYLYDGLNAADPRSGLRGTPLHSALLHELTVSTAAYGPTLGRSGAAVIAVRTAPSDVPPPPAEDDYNGRRVGAGLHGGVFFSYAPLRLTESTLGHANEALATRERGGPQGDVGVELGGPLVKDRLFFYAAFAPTFTTTVTDRVVRTATFDPRGKPSLRYATVAATPCPTYFRDERLCAGRALTELALTESRATPYEHTSRLYHGVARVEVRPARGHALTLQWLGAPGTSEGADLLREVETSRYQLVTQGHDLQARYDGRLLGDRLVLRAAYGLHLQRSEVRPLYADTPAVLYRASGSNPYSLYDFEDVPECRREMRGTDSGTHINFNPCPLTGYLRNGYGAYGAVTALRHVAAASIGAALRALGTHDLVAAFDFEHLQSDKTLAFSGSDTDPSDPFSLAGHRIYSTNATGTSLRIAREYATRDDQDRPVAVNGARVQASARNASLALRERWAPSFAPGLAIDAGLRWDLQALYDGDGARRVLLADELAPRVGLSYDWTRVGRSLLFVHYGRTYLSLPLAFGETIFDPAQELATGYTTSCPRTQINPGTDRSVPIPSSIPGAPCTFRYPYFAGSRSGAVADGLGGPYLDEAAAGYRHQLPFGIIVGASYVYRAFGQVLEDLAYDGLSSVVGNPGASVSASDGRALAPLPRGQRTTHAMVLTAQRELAGRFAFVASYSYARTYGNYDGWFSGHNGQLAPGSTTAFDQGDLLTNRSGPVATDRPHNLKLYGVYRQPLGKHGRLSLSAVFTAVSGRPINVLGAHPYFGPREVFVLPAGAGGRTPTLTQLDLSLRYEHALPKRVGVEVFVDLLNVLDQRAVTNVDDEYTASSVAPILNGQLADLTRLRTFDGSLPVLNPNYGAPTAYQPPLALRLGGRLTF